MSLPPNMLDAEIIATMIAEWAGVESPSYDVVAVNAMMDLAEAAMHERGAAVERISIGGATGDVVKARFQWDNPAPGILVLGHLDTVHLVGTLGGPLPVRRDGDRLYGPGVLDMKGGMVLALHAFDALIAERERLNLPVTFLFISDEEIGSPATRALIEREAKACKYVLVPEPGRHHALVTGRHAVLRYKLHLYGKPAHAARPGGSGRSAISAMAQLIQDVEGFSEQENEISYRVGIVEGGTFVNVVATECHAEVLCVAPSDNAFRDIQRRMGSLQSPDPEVRLEVEAGPVRPLFQAHEGTQELFEVAARVAGEIGLELEMGQ
ncbi:MAG: M20/M25/M40 family metallo-hydrolase, partial [Rhodospirillaceae bacterium]|nr:M20/M25/M40 family metallo-hydrolase [Rhodospirillaceae bacterium]